MIFPTFDLASFEGAVGDDRISRASQVDRICREVGFLVLTGHGIDQDVIARHWAAVQAFFAQDADAKHAVAAPYVGYPYGYLGPNKEALAKSKGEDTPPDLKESFNGGPLTVPAAITDPDALAFCHVPTLWPELDGFRRLGKITTL